MLALTWSMTFLALQIPDRAPVRIGAILAVRPAKCLTGNGLVIIGNRQCYRSD